MPDSSRIDHSRNHDSTDVDPCAGPIRYQRTPVEPHKRAVGDFFAPFRQNDNLLLLG
jgi:hypothetical protein